ncbi:hypothetical protein P7K49_010182 [Saguinus oedipus]|uniref:Uncharacterized protein n=1 Tax=Saguinus oedipus TaxID=9490 RepID=A0ABQ9VMT2_SAGOE|nr:hypothetical protein P7K49_010182 [Saguinus oedipus]
MGRGNRQTNVNHASQTELRHQESTESSLPTGCVSERSSDKGTGCLAEGVGAIPSDMKPLDPPALREPLPLGQDREPLPALPFPQLVPQRQNLWGRPPLPPDVPGAIRLLPALSSWAPAWLFLEQKPEGEREGLTGRPGLWLEGSGRGSASVKLSLLSLSWEPHPPQLSWRGAETFAPQVASHRSQPAPTPTPFPQLFPPAVCFQLNPS